MIRATTILAAILLIGCSVDLGHGAFILDDYGKQISAVREVNIQDADVLTDGSGNAAPAINAAIAQLPSSGGVIRLPIGTLRILSPIAWAGKNGIRIVGARSGQDSATTATRIIAGSYGMIMLDVRDAMHAHIEGVMLDGNNLAAYGIWMGIATTHDQHVQLRDVVITGVNQDAGTGLCLSYNANGSGSVSDSSFTNLQVSNCKIGVDNYAQNNSFYSTVMAGCSTAGLVARNYSQSNWTGGIFSGNNNDILLETSASIQSHNFTGIWFETSAAGIVAAVGGACAAPFTFTGCTLSTSSTAHLMDFTSIGGSVTIQGGMNYPVGVSSSVIKTNALGRYANLNCGAGSGIHLTFTGAGSVWKAFP